MGIPLSLDVGGSTTLKRPGLEIKRVNVDFPQWMVDALDQEAQRLGIHRQAVIKTWIAQKLDHQTESATDRA